MDTAVYPARLVLPAPVGPDASRRFSRLAALMPPGTRLQVTIRQAVATSCLSGVARAMRRPNLTYLSPEKLRTIERCLRSLRREQVPDDFLEAGVHPAGRRS